MIESEKQQLMITLKWIVAQNPDPKRSQISPYYPNDLPCNNLFEDDPPFYYSKYETVYYDRLAERILYLISKGYDSNSPSIVEKYCNIEIYASLINYMYEDIKKGFWGFVIDW